MKGADIAFPNIGIYFSNVPKSVSVAGFQIAFYGIIIACGMLLGIVMARWNAKRTGQNPDIYTDFALWGILFALIGARAYYVIFSWDSYKDDFMQIFNIRGGGLAIYGGVIAAVITAIVYCKRKNYNFLKFVDTAVTGLILGHINGLGIGTVLAAFTMGKVIGLIGDKMDKYFRFVNFTQHSSQTV